MVSSLSRGVSGLQGQCYMPWCHVCYKASMLMLYVQNQDRSEAMQCNMVSSRSNATWASSSSNATWWAPAAMQHGQAPAAMQHGQAPSGTSWICHKFDFELIFGHCGLTNLWILPSFFFDPHIRLCNLTLSCETHLWSCELANVTSAYFK